MLASKISHARPHAACMRRRTHHVVYASRPPAYTTAKGPVHWYEPGSNQYPLCDILVMSTFQAQQFFKVFNNSLLTSVAIAEVCGRLGLTSSLVFGHLAPAKSAVEKGVTLQIPHVWVEFDDRWVLDGALASNMPVEELIKMQASLEYVPSPATNPVPGMELPFDWQDQQKMQQILEKPEQYLQMLSSAPEGSPDATSLYVYATVVRGLTQSKEELLSLVQMSDQKPGA